MGCCYLKDIFQIAVCPLSARIASNWFECGTFCYGKNERCTGCQFSNGQYYRDDVSNEIRYYVDIGRPDPRDGK